VSYEEEDTCMSSADRASGYMRRRIHARHVSYEEEDTCIFCVTNTLNLLPLVRVSPPRVRRENTFYIKNTFFTESIF